MVRTSNGLGVMLTKWAAWLFDPAGLTPHGFCLLWQPGLIWLHALSDFGIGLAYFTIPFILVSVIRHRPDLVFRPLFGLFAAFILLCGVGHWLDMLTLWVPAYGVEGTVKAMTAAVSIVTAAVAWRLMPRALTLPSRAQMRQATEDLVAVRAAELRMGEIARQASIARDDLAMELARRRAAEAQVQASEARLRILLQSRVTEAIYLMDPNGTIETWNAAAERIKGYTAAEIIGRNFATFFTPEDLATGEPARLLATARELGRYSTGAWRMRKDGVRFLAHISLDAIRNDDGSLRGFVKVTQDITHQRVEDEQRAIMVEAAPNGMVIVDEAGLITLANTQVERIFDYATGTLIGRPVDLLVPRAVLAADAAHAANTEGGRVDGRAARQTQFTGRRRDGSPVTIDMMLRQVRTPRGLISILSLVDVTAQVAEAAARAEAERQDRLAAAATNAKLQSLSEDLARARDRAEQANQAKSRFLAGITHELRTPLHGILGYAELLSIEGALNHTQAERLEAMMAAGQHLLAMVNGVLDMSQIEADQLELHPSRIDLRALVRVCLDVVRPAAEGRGLVLVQAPAAPLEAVADATRLRQVLINLLGNAVKFTPAGSVTVRLLETDAGESFRLEVADTGPGVRAMHREKLFQTFERLNAEAVSGIEGTGLGLAIAAGLVRLMGGRIGYADNPGGGSVFWLEFPTRRDEAVPHAEAAASPPSAAARPLRVLVADDEALNRNIAREFLRRAGHDVVCVESGAAAVEAAAAADFDAVLMDVRMPSMNGLQATRLIRALPPPRGQVRVVAVTAQAFAQQIETCRQAGMDSHVSKPFTKAALLAALEDPAGPATTPNGAALSLPIFERPTLQGVSEYLSPADVDGYLRALSARCEGLLERLRAPGGPVVDPSFIEETHALAGSAGTLGFARIGAAARVLEMAAMKGAADLGARSAQLAAAIEESMETLREEIAAVGAGIQGD